MEQQLVELYKEKEVLSQHFPGLAVKDIIDLTRSIQGQLDSLMEDQVDRLIREREQLDRAFPGMTIDEIIHLAKQGMNSVGGGYGGSTSSDVALNMEAQLISLYEEKQQLATAFPGLDAHEIVDELNRKIRRLESLYARAA